MAGFSFYDSISTERLTLNVVSVPDHEFVNELVNSAGWIEFIGDRNIHSKEAAIAYIDKIRNTPNLTYWVIHVKQTQTPIGIVSWMKRNYLDHFDIGFALLPQYEKKGYAFESAQKVLSMVMSQTEHSIILATTLPDNISSISLLTKLGFQFEKEIRNANEALHVYSITIQ